MMKLVFWVVLVGLSVGVLLSPNPWFIFGEVFAVRMYLDLQKKLRLEQAFIDAVLDGNQVLVDAIYREWTS